MSSRKNSTRQNAKADPPQSSRKRTLADADDENRTDVKFLKPSAIPSQPRPGPSGAYGHQQETFGKFDFEDVITKTSKSAADIEDKPVQGFDFERDVLRKGRSTVKHAGAKPQLRFLKDLTSSNTGDWIEVRVCLSQLTTMPNGKSRLFLHLMDVNRDVIAMTLWEKIADEYKNTLQVNRCLRITGYAFKSVNPAMTPGVNKDVELGFANSTKVDEIDADTLPRIPFKFEQLDSVDNKRVGDKIDCVGVIVKNKLEQNKNGKFRRELHIYDRSTKTVLATLWEPQCLLTSENKYATVAIRGGIISSFGGRSIATDKSTLIWETEELEECGDLAEWFESRMIANVGVDWKQKM